MASAEGSDTFEPACRQYPTRVILLVEATAAAAGTWRGTRRWMDTILQMTEKDSDVDPTSAAAKAAGQQEVKTEQGMGSKVPRFQYALIVYATHDRSTPAPVQVSGWTSQLSQVATWLDGIQFVGGVASKGTALAHALAEAIALSKTPYPGGAKPAAAAASQPGLLSLSDHELGAHTHLILSCPAFNPCRLPLRWPCAVDTKQALFTSKHYTAFLEKFKAMRNDKLERVAQPLFAQLEFINASLTAITPGTVDVWDLLLALPRHKISLSVMSSISSISSRHTTNVARGLLEPYAYSNHCLSNLKLDCQRGLLFATNMSAVVYISPMFTEGTRAFKPLMQKVIQSAKKKAAQQHAQREANAAAAAQSQQSSAATTGQTSQNQQTTTSQQPQQHQQQQQPQQQQWQAAAAAAGPRSAVPVQQQQQQQQQPVQINIGVMPAANQAGQQQQPPQRLPTPGPQQAVGMAQQQPTQQQQQAAPQQQQQQARYGTLNMSGAVAAGHVQQQQQPQAGLQLQVQGAMGMQPGLLPQQQQQQQPGMVMMMQHQQMMMQQQPQQLMSGVAGFMPQQQQQQQMMQRQQQLVQQQQQAQQQPQVQMPMAAVGQQQQPAQATAAGQKHEKQRQAFWRGRLVLHLPELGMTSPQAVAEVELSSSSGANMQANWAPRNHMLMHEVVNIGSIGQYVKLTPAQQQQGNKVARVHFKVVQQHPAFNWLQNQVYARPDKQVILMGNITPQLKGLLVVGNQTLQRSASAAAQVNMMEGQLILSGIGT